MMKTTKLILICLLASFGAMAQINTPAPSPAGSVTTMVGLTEVKIDYFRPSMKGRQIFGEGDDYLLQLGELWRTGANSGTKLTLSTDAKVAGVDVKEGTYLILSVPGKEEFEFILYSDPSIGGNMSRVEDEKKVVSTKVKVTEMPWDIETMTFSIQNIAADNTSADIWFGWEKSSFSVPIEVEYDEMVMKDIASKTKVRPGNYMQAANYYLNAGKDLNQALEWVNMYLAIGENSKQFWNVYTKARILAELGMKKEAIAAAEESIATAKANEGGDFGYIKRNEDLIAEVKAKK